MLLEQRFKRNPKTYRKALKAKKKIHTIAGRLLRELLRKLPEKRKDYYQEELDLFARVLNQKKADHDKIYSLHEPGVYCISKGKEHRKYEFGSKVSILVTAHSGIITSALSFAKNVFDGHTLEATLEQHEKLTGQSPKEVIADRGYKGVKSIGTTQVSIPGRRKNGLTSYEIYKIREKFPASSLNRTGHRTPEVRYRTWKELPQRLYRRQHQRDAGRSSLQFPQMDADFFRLWKYYQEFSILRLKLAYPALISPYISACILAFLRVDYFKAVDEPMHVLVVAAHVPASRAVGIVLRGAPQLPLPPAS